MARRTTPSPAKEPEQEQVYPVGGDQGQQHQPQGEQEEGDHQHPSHLGQKPQGEGEREEEKSCSHSMHIRMPGSIVQASQGGTTPMESLVRPVINHTSLKRMRQPILRWPVADDELEEKDEDKEKEDAEPTPSERDHSEGGGHGDGDDARYKEFLEYCEERRVAWARKEEEDEARKRDAKRKEDHWRLLRESVTFLRENEDKWQRRRIKEVTNLRE